MGATHLAALNAEAQQVRLEIARELVGDAPRVLFHAWEFAYWAALRIALRERRPYESDRTRWGAPAGYAS
jgi:hypothetical protein